MPRLAALLAAELRQHATREARRNRILLRKLQRRLEGVRGAHRQQRRRLRTLERRLQRLAALVSANGTARARRGSGVPGRPLTPESIVSLRRRLGLSRLRFARLLNVSSGSIFGWEKGRTIPRRASRARIAEVRKMGLRAARTRAGIVSGRGERRAPGGRRRKASGGRRSRGRRG